MSWFDPPDILRDLDGLDASLRFSEVLLSRQKRDTAENWINVGIGGAPGFAPGWSNYSISSDGQANPAAYFKTTDGWVFIRGLVASTAGATATIFGLPGGYRPQYREVILINYSQATPARIDILPAGDVQVELVNPGSFTGGLQLDGMRFRAYVP